MKVNYLVIEGNIGVGKTSLVKMIARDFGARMLLEQFKDNPFLPKFYEDQQKYAFPLEMSFLADRYKQLKQGLTQPELFSNFLVADYYFTKSLIFARNTLADDEFRLYSQFFEIIYDKIPKPDLYVFLHADTEVLLKNIRERNRNFERNIQPEYLDRISAGYSAYLKQEKQFPVLLLNMTNLDFVKNSGHYKAITDRIFGHEYIPGIHMSE